MFKRTLLAILAMLVLTPNTAKADFYKYVDKNGNIVFTDDLSTIPKNQRSKAEKYDEPPPSARNKESVEKNEDGSANNKALNLSTTKEEMNKKI